ncbi:MAG: FAD-dependent oxidoreductase [Polyangiales bacterium]
MSGGLLWIVAILVVGVLIWVAFRGFVVGGSVARAIERRLGGFRQQANAIDASLPREVAGNAPRVAVIGGGLAGIGAAATLAERGIEVSLFERNGYLGGKIGAWKEDVGATQHTVDHGFHAFFRQYYNLNRFLVRLGISEHFAAIEDYLILDAEGRPWSFGDVSTTPVLNILDLGRRGFFRWRDVVRKRTRTRLESFVRFDIEHTYAAFDDMTFQQLCDDAALPAELRVSFRTFARAFFSDEVDLSAADVLRAFHFYYLSHDHGLMYDYPRGDYETAVVTPMRAHLDAHSVSVTLNADIREIERGKERRFRIDGTEYDWVVLAASIPGMQQIVAGSPWIAESSPELASQLRSLETAHGYAVWRLWTDRDVRPGLPTFTNVERRSILDSVTTYHRITDEARAWAAEHDGAVLELHSYAIAPDVSDVRAAFLEDLEYYFPELVGMRIHHEVLQVRDDFPAFAPGQRALRPSPELPIQGLLVAGDWVKLPYPMTHMEAAFTSGVASANVVFDDLRLQQEPIYTVAPRGLLPAKPRT